MLNRQDRAFVNQIIMELYDAEVAKHPEGVRPADARAAILPQVREILAKIRGSQT